MLKHTTVDTINYVTRIENLSRDQKVSRVDSDQCLIYSCEKRCNRNNINAMLFFNTDLVKCNQVAHMRGCTCTSLYCTYVRTYNVIRTEWQCVLYIYYNNYYLRAIITFYIMP